MGNISLREFTIAPPLAVKLHHSVTQRTADTLTAAVANIKREKRFKFLMTNYAQYGEPADGKIVYYLEDWPLNFDECGTALDFAGRIVFDNLATAKTLFEGGYDTPIGKVAKELAGLDDNQAEKLFFKLGWPTKFILQYDSGEGAEALEARVSHFLLAGK